MLLALDTTRYTLWRHRRHWGDLYIGASGIPERMIIESNQVLDRLRPDVF